MSGSAQPAAVRLPRPAFRPRLGSALLSRGIVVTWLSVIVLIPLAAVVFRSFEDGFGSFWDYATNPQALDALQLTVLAALAVTSSTSSPGRRSPGCSSATTSPASGSSTR